MTCIGLHYSNSKIFNLEYKEVNIKEIGYGSIDIVHSNILREVEFVLQNTSNKDEFNNYFLGNKFLSNIKDVSKSELNGVLVNIPTKIKIDNINGLLEFNIISTVRDDIYIKKFQASVKIKNPFFSQVVTKKDEISEGNISDTIQVHQGKLYENEGNYKQEHIENLNILHKTEKQIREFDINKIVTVYNYKEI
ncbi:hypothetical protein [Romboutsia sp.]|uniref:hypothetical protein n=1 Tax=Romboutsia sp. TaxID=1965302 RepID=UPI002D7FB690|nr:hypothetical protein [Romboutsia sp.]